MCTFSPDSVTESSSKAVSRRLGRECGALVNEKGGPCEVRVERLHSLHQEPIA